MSLNQELNKLTEQINIITSNKKHLNFESRMNRAGEQIEQSNLRKSKSKTLKYSGYESNCRKEMKIRRAKYQF